MTKEDDALPRLLVLILIACFCAFFPTLSGQYLHFDEHISITGNPIVHQPFGWQGLKNIFTSTVDNQYTPLSVMTFWLEKNTVGLLPEFSRIINLLLHLTCTVFVFLFSRALTGKTELALTAAALFAVHPLQVESVAWALGRRTLLFGLFLFASLHFYVKYIDSMQSRWLWVSCMFVLLSGLAKSLAFLAPISFFIVDWYRQRSNCKQLFREKIPLLIISSIIVTLLIVTVSNSIPLERKSDTPFKTAAYAISFYIGKTLLPANLAFFYEVSPEMQSWFNLGFYFLFGIVAIFVFFFRKNRLAIAGSIFFLLNIIPLSGILRVGYHFYAGMHFMYVPIWGLIIILAGLWHEKLFKKHFKAAVTMVSVIVFVCLVLTFQYATIWQSSFSLFGHALKINPDLLFPRNQLIYAMLRAGQYEESAPHSRELIARHPDFFLGYNSLARYYQMRGDYENALKYFNKTLQLNATRHGIIRNRGEVLLKLHRYEEAERDFTTAIKGEPALYIVAQSHELRAEARRLQGKYQAAYEDHVTNLGFYSSPPIRMLYAHINNDFERARLDLILWQFVVAIEKTDFYESIVTMLHNSAMTTGENLQHAIWAMIPFRNLVIRLWLNI